LTLTAAAQQGYPTRPIRLVVPFAPGGGVDNFARPLAQKLTDQLGQQVVVDNRPGAGTMIGTELVAKAPPDGYTLLLGLSTLATNPVIYRKVSYNALADFAPVTLALTAPNILVVHPSLPVKTVKELIWFSQARPGQLNYSSAGLGTSPHLSMELFLSMAGLKMAHIPYKGSAPAMIDLLSGQVTTMVATMLTALPHVRGGRLRALGITGTKRSAAAQEVPTIAEAGVPGYALDPWLGLFMPAKTPQDIVMKVHGEVVKILNAPELKARLGAQGIELVTNSPADFARFVREDNARWGRLIKEAGIKGE
jgi:tripartite-type tricarboxylate transporter receptor subunit TctC